LGGKRETVPLDSRLTERSGETTPQLMSLRALAAGRTMPA